MSDSSWKAVSGSDATGIRRPARVGEVEFRRSTGGLTTRFSVTSGAVTAAAENELATRAKAFLDDSPDLSQMVDEQRQDSWLRVVVAVDGTCFAQFPSRPAGSTSEGTLYADARAALAARLGQTG